MVQSRFWNETVDTLYFLSIHQSFLWYIDLKFKILEIYIKGEKIL